MYTRFVVFGHFDVVLFVCNGILFTENRLGIIPKIDAHESTAVIDTCVSLFCSFTTVDKAVDVCCCTLS